MQSRVQGLITEPPSMKGDLWSGPFIVLSPLQEDTRRMPKSAVAQSTNTIPARIRLAACGDEAASLANGVVCLVRSARFPCRRPTEAVHAYLYWFNRS